MLRHPLVVASFLTIAGILFPVLSLISGADRALLEDSSIITWETYNIQPTINKRLASAYLSSDDAPEIPPLIPEWYSLHYFTLCSGTFIWSADKSSTAKRPTKSKNATSTHCTPRWFDQPTNLTQILLYAAAKGLQDSDNFPTDVWDETALEDMANNIASILVIDYPDSTSAAYPAVGTLFTGFAFTVFSVPLTLGAAFIAMTERSMFRILPHMAMSFASIGALFLTASARLESSITSSSAGSATAGSKISASSSALFQGFQWSGALGMWLVVLTIWFGSILGQKVVVSNSRFREKLLAQHD